MRVILYGLVLLQLVGAYAECVHEGIFEYHQLKELAERYEVNIRNEGRYIPFQKQRGKLQENHFYSAQISHARKRGSFDRYNRRHLPYYRYSRIQNFLEQRNKQILQRGHQIEIIGQSIEGRNIYAIFPKHFKRDKKTIVMFGRHHGDEGTANWIIEGFVKHWLKNTSTDFQLVLYPMVNPDGAEKQSRYNSNRRDLNRSWSEDPARSRDEAGIIHRHLIQFIHKNKNVVSVLDMHGSFSKDFIYRVDRDFMGETFFQRQQELIDELSTLDPFQRGQYQFSNGHPGMARIRLITDYQFNAITHETPRDIRLANREQRSIKSLEQQGIALYRSLENLY
jgi:hypothetical protein